jgi:hypothetical protein
MRVEIDLARPHLASAGLARGTGIFFHAHSLQPRCHPHGVAIGATRRHDGATGKRIPGRFGPFDVGRSHGVGTLRLEAKLALTRQVSNLVPEFSGALMTTDEH